MKAKIVSQVSNAKNYASENETISTYNVVALVKGELKDVITCRCYMGRSKSASTVYASIWVGLGDTRTSGTGSAGGYGYHKSSAAVQDAITNAGIELYGGVYGREDTNKRCFIDGVGESAIESALIAIAKTLGCKGKILIVCN